MLARSTCLCGRGALLVLSLAPLAAAQSPIPPQSPAPPPAVLWYRSSEGCPDSASFLTSIGERASLVRLAEAGDHVDFVVNLSATKEGAHGRLEVETERGTVAIREAQDDSCERVAQVIALNLALALEPGSSEAPTRDAAPPPRTTISAEGDAKAPSSDPESAPGSAYESPQPGALEEEETRHTTQTDDRSDRHARFRVGVQGGLLSGLGTGIMARGGLFVEARDWISWAPRLSVRLAGIAAAGSSETELGKLKHTLWAGRIELCPYFWGGDTVSFGPCASAEIGQLRASGPLSDAALWGAVGAHARGVWTVASPLSLEADAGANFPLSHYDVLAGSTVLYRSSVVGVSAVVGASLQF